MPTQTEEQYKASRTPEQKRADDIMAAFRAHRARDKHLQLSGDNGVVEIWRGEVVQVPANATDAEVEAAVLGALTKLGAAKEKSDG